MIGDKLIIEQFHTDRATDICRMLAAHRLDRFVFTVAGESGSGKSELASEIARLLTEAGYNVTLAKDGAEALHLIREEHPDLY